MVYFLRHEKKKGDRAIEATHNWCDLDEEIWKKIKTGRSLETEEFQNLVHAAIGAHLVWLDTHPFLDKKLHESYRSNMLRIVGRY